MKNIKIFLLVSIVVVFALTSTSVAKAADTPGCGDFGGVWKESSGGTKATCSFSPGHFYSRIFCRPGYGAVDYWVNPPDWEFGHQTCNLPTTTLNNEVDVLAGVPVDLWYGNCGAYISAPPVNGIATLSKVGRGAVPNPTPNLRTICQISYSDSNGSELANFGSPAWVYYNLDAATANLWDSGELNIFIYHNETWQACSNPLFVEAGEFGRIACFSSNPVYFGIGTDLTFKRKVMPSGLIP